MAGRGGKRAGAGRKLDASALRLREWYRERLWRDREQHYRIALSNAKKGDASLLNRLFDKVMPTPTELDINIGSIPEDFVFRCEFSTRGGAASPGIVPLPGGGHGGGGD